MNTTNDITSQIIGSHVRMLRKQFYNRRPRKPLTALDWSSVALALISIGNFLAVLLRGVMEGALR